MNDGILQILYQAYKNVRINAIQLAKGSISGLSKVFAGSECPLSTISNWKHMNKTDYGKAKAMLISSAQCLQSLYSCSIMLPLISQLLYGIYSPNWLPVTVSFCKTQNAIFETWQLSARLLSAAVASGDPTV